MTRKIRSIRNSRLVKPSSPFSSMNAKMCVACETVVSVLWRHVDEERPDDFHHCPYCGANDSLVTLVQEDYSRDYEDVYEVGVREE